jgi:alpha 1,2-mannosyltransferase
MTPELIDALKILDVTCHNISDYTEDSIEGWAMKPMAILSSSFKEVLYLDSDIVCMANPELLFDLPEYREFGALFWPDFWETEEDNSIWEVLKIPPVKMKEQESGQLLIDKERCWKELHLATYFNIHNYIYYHLLYGDKDTFRFAWMALNTPFYFVEGEPSSCGYMDSEGYYLGNTMVQYLPDGDKMFLHRNLSKWHLLKDNNERWQIIKRFAAGAKQKKYYYPYKKGSMNLTGDTEMADSKNEFGDMEKSCLKYLGELRQAEWYVNAFGRQLER